MNPNQNPHNEQGHDAGSSKQPSPLTMALLLDEGGGVTYAGASVLAGLGYQPAELVGQCLFDYVSPEEVPAARQALKLALGQEGVPVQAGFRLRHQAGLWLKVQATMTNFLKLPQVEAVITTLVVSAEGQGAEPFRSDEKFAALFELAPDAIFLADLASGLIVDANPAAVDLMDKDREQLIGTHFTSLHPPDQLAYAQELFGHPLPPGQLISAWSEIEILTGGGKRRTVEIRGRIITLDERAYVLGSFRDITERKEAELALRQSEARNRAILEAIPDLMFRVTRQGEIIDFQAATPEELVLPPDQVIGSKIASSMPAETVALILEKIAAALETGLPQLFEYSLPVKGGQHVFEARLMSSGPEEVVAIIRNITTRKETEEQLRQLSQAMEQNPASIIITDVDGNIEYVNPAFTHHTGYSFAEVKGLNPNILKSGLTPPQVYVELWDTVLGGDIYHCEFHNQKKNGELCWDEAVISPIFNDLGQITHLLAIQENITERKLFEQERINLEMQLRQTQRLETIGTLAGGIAHDFNNILTPILGFSELALIRSTADNPIRPQLEHIFRAAHRAKDLVQQILTFSRQTEQKRVATFLPPLIKEVLKLLRPSLPTTIEIRHDIDPACPPILADPSQLHQVLMNLCTNAYHAMQKTGGVLTIELSHLEGNQIPVTHPTLGRQDYACLTVTDTGHGMEPATLDRIFEPFFTTKQLGKGTGLGLSVVHGIVKSHGGVIVANSTPGLGTTFELYFPVAEAETGVENQPLPPSPGHKERILLVDDEPTIVELLADWLINAGYRVTSRTSSLEALVLFQEDPHQFEVVITDLTMPHTTGLGLARALKTIRPDLPIILITGYGEDLNEANLIQSGINQVVMKPIVFNDLGLALRKVLDGVA